MERGLSPLQAGCTTRPSGQTFERGKRFRTFEDCEAEGMKGYNSRPLIAGWRRLCTPYRRLGARRPLSPPRSGGARRLTPRSACESLTLGLEVPLKMEQICLSLMSHLFLTPNQS